MTKANLAQLRRLVGNPDAYAVQHDDGSWHPVRQPLTDKVLLEHVRGERTVGTYVGHKEVLPTEFGRTVTVSRTLVFDLDTGDDARYHADAIATALQDLNVPLSSIGIEYSGRKGYHVWVPLQEFQPSAELRRLGRAVVAIARAETPDIPENVEVFPKQDEVRDLGNLVKLPGGVHRVTGNHNDFVGMVPHPLAAKRWLAIIEQLPEEQHARRSTPVDNRFPCLEHIQQGVSEGGRNNQLFHLATMFRRHGATEETVELVVRHVNEKCDPPLDEAELESLLESSRTSGPICYALPGDVREACGDLCIRERTAGLYTRPGQLKHAGAGENVVVTIGTREGSVVTFEHDDLVTAKGAIRSEES